MKSQGMIQGTSPTTSGVFLQDLGEMWRYGCSRSPDWDSDSDSDEVDDGVEEKAMSGYVAWNIRFVLEGLL